MASEYGSDSTDYNPWEAMDAAINDGPQGTNLDCYSVTTITTVLLMQAGVNVNIFTAFATSDLDASSLETMHDSAYPTIDLTDLTQLPYMDRLDFFDSTGTNTNLFEAYLTLYQDGQPPQADTVFPFYGPLSSMSGTVSGLPSDPQAQLAFTVIYTTLQGLRDVATDSKGGQQYWIGPSLNVADESAVAFPITIP